MQGGWQGAVASLGTGDRLRARAGIAPLHEKTGQPVRFLSGTVFFGAGNLQGLARTRRELVRHPEFTHQAVLHRFVDGADQFHQVTLATLDGHGLYPRRQVGGGKATVDGHGNLRG